MRRVFADTGYFLALLNPRDALHRVALDLAQDLSYPLLTTTWVLTEVADACAKPPNRQRFTTFVDRLRRDPTATVVGLDQDLFEQGLGLFRNRPDKEWSLTDCISFVVMEREGLTEAFTGDRHFVQAGFNALLA
ncbi:MAG: hypothetical protein GHCLOJNM_01795 [bacterium]|nr:hypothetical protein [bacterium]